MASSTAEPKTAPEQADKRRWNAFVCQDCRGIFRIPADYNGRGVVCPCCERMLRIPRAGESTPALVQSSESSQNREAPQPIAEKDEPEFANSMEMPETAPSSIEEPQFPDPVTEQHGQLRRRKKHRDRSKDAESDWQQQRGQKLQFSRRIPIYWWWGAAALAFLIVGGAMVALLAEKPKFTSAAVPSVISAPVNFPTNDKAESDAEAIKHLQRLADSYAVIEKFFAAESVESIMPLLRPVAGLEEKVRRYYRSVPVKMAAYEGIEKSTSQFLADHQVMQTQVRLLDQSPRTISLLKVGDDYKVDWESWVGWSEMDLATLKKTRPTNLTEVRVIVEMVSYYNYDFSGSSEAEWQSYRLTFAHSDQFLHGYIERSSPVNDAVRLASDQMSRLMTLRIRYRDANSHPSQVLIESVVADGWVTDMPK